MLLIEDPQAAQKPQRSFVFPISRAHAFRGPRFTSSRVAIARVEVLLTAGFNSTPNSDGQTETIQVSYGRVVHLLPSFRFTELSQPI